MKPIAVIFGCGERGQFFLRELNKDFHVAAYADNNSALWGKEVLGLPVVPPDEIRRLENATVFICVEKGYLDIAKQLEEMGICGVYLDWFGMAYRYRDMVLYPTSFYFCEPYKKTGGQFSVLFVQKAACGRTDKISSALKAKGVEVQIAYTRCSSKMPEAYCKENAFYSFDEMLKYINESDFDIVHCSNEPDVLANLLLHCNKPVVTDTHDLMTARNNESSFETYYLEYAANKFAAGNMYVGAYYRDLQVQRYGVSPERTFLLPNLPLENQIPANMQRKPKLSASDGELHLVYEGGIGTKRKDHRFMEDIWRKIVEAHIHVHYYSQQEIEYCQALEKTSPYFHYEGNLSSLELIVELTQYDVGSLLLNPIDKNAMMAYPNKLYEYLAAGLPVVSNLTVPLEFVLSHSVGGTLDLQGDIQKQLRKIADIQVPGRFLQENKLTMNSRADEILAFYKKIIELGRVRKK